MTTTERAEPSESAATTATVSAANKQRLKLAGCAVLLIVGLLGLYQRGLASVGAERANDIVYSSTGVLRGSAGIVAAVSPDAASAAPSAEAAPSPDAAPDVPACNCTATAAAHTESCAASGSAASPAMFEAAANMGPETVARMQQLSEATKMNPYELLLALRKHAKVEGQIFLPQKPPSSEYSSAAMFRHNGYSAIVGYNLCLKDGRVTAFLPSNTLGQQQAKTFDRRLKGFKYGDMSRWSVKIGEAIPSSAMRVPGSSFLVAPPWGHHVGHAWDGLAMLWHAHVHPGRIPFADGPINSAVFWTLGGPDYKYLEALRPMMLAPFRTADDKPVPLVPGSEFAAQAKAHGGVVCYEKALFPGLPNAGRPYSQSSFFSCPADAEAFRHFAYNYLGVSEPDRRRTSKARVLILNRKCPKSRCIYNHQELLDYIRRDPDLSQLLDLDWALKYQSADNLGVMDSETLKTQVEMMRHTDILIGTHGSGLTNSIFMESGSSVIEVLHPHLYEPIFGSMSESAGMTHHIFPTTTADPQSSSCKVDRCSSQTLLEHWHRADCRQKFKSCRVTITKPEMDILAAELLLMAQKVFATKRPPIP